MDDTQQVAPEGVDPETGEVREPETDAPEQDTQPDEELAPDDEQPDDDEPQIETAPDDDPSIEAQKRELDKMNTSLEREGTRHRNRVSEIIGESANELLPCPLCSDWIDGIIPPVQPPDEVVEKVKATLGLAPEVNYKQAPFAHRCETCDGLGGVVSGSLVSGNEIIICQPCNGSGYKLDNNVAPLAGMVPPPNGEPQTVTPPGLNPDDPFMQEARERGLMVMPLPALPTYADGS